MLAQSGLLNEIAASQHSFHLLDIRARDCHLSTTEENLLPPPERSNVPRLKQR